MYLNRHVEQKLHQYTEFFKVVLLVGARQVGKSTLLRHVFPNYRCVVFDAVQDLYNARRDPDFFLDNFPSPLILDEIQYAPELLSAIKRRVDESGGRYILTGSQNLNVLRSAAESLAGRVGILHLEAMTTAEMAGLGSQPQNWLADYLASPQQFSVQMISLSNLPSQLWRGCFPGLLEAPDALVPAYWESYVQTYLERDLRMMYEIRDLADFHRFLRLLAALSAQEINYSQLGREIGIAPKTSRIWAESLLHGYQWRELPPYSGNVVKRLSKKSKGYLTDTGLICYLQSIASPTVLAGHPLLGAIFETFAVNLLLRHAARMSPPPSAYHWRSNGGAEVDLVFAYNDKLFPIEMKSTVRLSAHDSRGIRGFHATYPGKAAIGVILYAGKEFYRLNDVCWAVPWNSC